MLKGTLEEYLHVLLLKIIQTQSTVHTEKILVGISSFCRS